MSKQSLNDQEFLDKAFEALTSGNGTEVNTLMNSEKVELTGEAPASLDSNTETTDDTGSTPPVEEKSTGEVKAEDSGQTSVTPPVADDDKDDPYQWLKDLPEDKRKAVEQQLGNLLSDNTRLQQYYRSNEGRIGGLQRKINSLERELDTRKTQSPPETKATAHDVTIEDDETLAQLKEDDPALYRVLKQREEKTLREAQKLVDKARAEFNSTLEKQIAPIYESREEDYIRQEQSKVLQVVTNADKVVASKEWKMFEDTASPGIKTLINSNDSRDVIQAFRIYKNWLVDTGLVKIPVNKPQENLQNVPPAQTAANTAAADKVLEARQRKLQSGAVGSSNLTNHNEEVDAEKLLEKYFQEIFEKEGYNSRFVKK